MEGFVGHASYLVMCTRPDNAQCVKVLSRYVRKFGARHVQFAKNLLRYLKGTKKKGLVYTSVFPQYLQIFTDASHASCVDTRRSITSVVVKLGGNTIMWKSAFTRIVSHGSCESELMALDVGAMLSQFCGWLIQSMGRPLVDKVQVFVDNAGTISLASNPIQSGRNVHVHARYFYVRDLVFGDKLQIETIPTELQVAAPTN